MLRVETDSVPGLVFGRCWGSEEGGTTSIIEVEKLKLSQEGKEKRYKRWGESKRF